MKKSKKTIVCLVIALIFSLVVCMLVGCDNGTKKEDDKPVTLSAPADVTIAKTTLSWTAVENASKYSVQIGDNTAKEYTTNSVALADEIKTPGTYSIKVKAIGDGKKYSDSAWAESVSYTATVAQGYKLVLEGFEYGAAITKIVIEAIDTVEANSINDKTFAVKSGTSNRIIEDAYVSDSKGNIQETGSSKYITIEMTVAYNQYDCNPFTLSTNDDPLCLWKDLAKYTVSLKSGKKITVGGTQYSAFDVAADMYDGKISPSTDDLVKGTYTFDNKTLNYAAYETTEMKESAGKNALVIWLHGLGEGGTDIDIALLGNDVTNLMESGIQSYFKDSAAEATGAYVLALQAPTMWMDEGDGAMHLDEEGYEGWGKTSTYTDVLMKSIEAYVDSNDDVDKNRIYIGGCSNGGFMVMNMLLHGTENYFAAAYPVCQVYRDAYIDDTMLNRLKDIPIWFTQAENDLLVTPANYTIATYTRLVRAGAENVHFSYLDKVEGLDDPSVNDYARHWSWVYTLNDRCQYDQDAAAIASATDFNAAKALVTAPSDTVVKINNSEVNLWQWLAAQSKS